MSTPIARALNYSNYKIIKVPWEFYDILHGKANESCNPKLIMEEYILVTSLRISYNLEKMKTFLTMDIVIMQ